MPLAAGDHIPDFEALTDDGRTLRSDDLRGATTILYFFPRASMGGT
jgi:peroxiredoxin